MYFDHQNLASIWYIKVKINDVVIYRPNGDVGATLINTWHCRLNAGSRRYRPGHWSVCHQYLVRRDQSGSLARAADGDDASVAGPVSVGRYLTARWKTRRACCGGWSGPGRRTRLDGCHRCLCNFKIIGLSIKIWSGWWIKCKLGR